MARTRVGSRSLLSMVGLSSLIGLVGLIGLAGLTGCSSSSNGDSGTVGGGTGGGSGGGGGDVGGGSGGGTVDAGPPDAGSCVIQQIAEVDPNGYPFVKLSAGASGAFWSVLGSNDVSVIRYGTTFETAQSLGDAGTLLDHAVAADTEAHVVWIEADGAGSIVHSSHFDGTHWTAGTPASRADVANSPTLSTVGGQAAVVWNEVHAQFTSLQYQRFSSGTWSAPARLDTVQSPDGGATPNPSAASATHDGTGPVVFWGQGVPVTDGGATDYREWVADLSTATPAVFSTSQGGYANLAAGNAEGDLIVLEQQADSSLLSHRWSRTAGFGTAAQPGFDAISTISALAMTSDGNALASWSDSNNKAAVSVNGISSNGWVPLNGLTDNNGWVAADGTRGVLVLQTGKTAHFRFRDGNSWGDPLVLPVGVPVSAIDALVVTADHQLAMSVTSPGDNGAPDVKYAVVCH